MPKVFGKKRARREGFSRQQRHPLGLRVGTIALPTHHGPRRPAQLELGLRRLLPRRDRKNLAKFAPQAAAHWQDLQARIEWVPNALTTKRPLLLTASKDKPVLISALAAKCDTLLTLDTGDFGIVLGTEVYGMRVGTPRDFLVRAGLGLG